MLKSDLNGLNQGLGSDRGNFLCVLKRDKWLNYVQPFF